ncbi:MAG: hypothetical protein AAFR27_14390 [Pseudomonadota bacterium]
MHEAFAFHPSRTYGRDRQDHRQADKPNFTAAKTSALQNLGRSLAEPSLIARYTALDPIAKDAFQERAAILEYQDGMTRPQAELEALRMVMHTIQQGL